MTADLAAPPQTCKRRQNALWTTCRCAKCGPHHRRILKLHHAGMLNRPAADQAVALIQAWRAEGYSILWIATAANVNKAWVLTVANGKVTQPGPLLTSRILAADISTGTAGFCASLGPRRRLQALAIMGWNLDDISRRYDIPTAVLSRIRTGTAGDVHAVRYATIVRAYDDLADTRGPSSQGAARARNLGWAPPAAWDDPDDPRETYEPHTKRLQGGKGRPVSDLVEDIEWLLRHDGALTAGELAERFGYADRSAIQNALARHGHRDLLERLNRNAERAA